MPRASASPTYAVKKGAHSRYYVSRRLITGEPRRGTRRTACPGRSLVVLPFEFSHCLEAQPLSADAETPRLVRVNAIETGVLFNERVSAPIRYFAGLFHNPACRIRDSRDFPSLLGLR